MISLRTELSLEIRPGTSEQGLEGGGGDGDGGVCRARRGGAALAFVCIVKNGREPESQH